jgi:hypothetical protein
MTDNTDIVTWLRSILHNDRSVELNCREAANEIERLREEQEDTHALIERTGAILTATANALHGGYAPPDCLHSWHDLPELVEQLRKERDEARRAACKDEAIIRLQRNRVHRDSEEVVGLAKEISVERGWEYLKDNP